MRFGFARGFSAFAMMLVVTGMTGRSFAQATAVGTFDRQAIVVAYYRSPQWAAMLEQKQAQLRLAKQSNDSDLVRELSAWGEQSQELAHKQLTGEAPISNVLDALRPAFQEIQRSMGLRDIVLCPDAKAQTVDLTAQLLDWLKADENTRKLIRQLPRQTTACSP